jgi:hypothetical protein
VPSGDDDIESDVHFDLGEDGKIHLHGFSTDDDLADDGSATDFEATPFGITVTNDDATIKRKLDKVK